MRFEDRGDLWSAYLFDIARGSYYNIQDWYPCLVQPFHKTVKGCWARELDRSTPPSHCRFNLQGVKYVCNVWMLPT